MERERGLKRPYVVFSFLLCILLCLEAKVSQYFGMISMKGFKLRACHYYRSLSFAITQSFDPLFDSLTFLISDHLLAFFFFWNNNFSIMFYFRFKEVIQLSVLE